MLSSVPVRFTEIRPVLLAMVHTLIIVLNVILASDGLGLEHLCHVLGFTCFLLNNLFP